MDLKDRQILNLLQEDCSLSLQALAEQVNLSPPLLETD
ncbi:Lrp/AsnC family transcriptional regulator [Aliamphritea spongicola]|nr:Lrp/AsnC family transcriptional regulator [Aliamphritea spongicola]